MLQNTRYVPWKLNGHSKFTTGVARCCKGPFDIPQGKKEKKRERISSEFGLFNHKTIGSWKMY